MFMQFHFLLCLCLLGDGTIKCIRVLLLEMISNVLGYYTLIVVPPSSNLTITCVYDVCTKNVTQVSRACTRPFQPG